MKKIMLIRVSFPSHRIFLRTAKILDCTASRNIICISMYVICIAFVLAQTAQVLQSASDCLDTDSYVSAMNNISWLYIGSIIVSMLFSAATN